MELINALVEEYASKITSPDDDLLQQIQQQTLANHPHAHMLSSPVQGKILTFLSTILQPKYVLEIGTFTGYSALCLAKGLTANGELHTIELRNEDAQTAEKNFSFSAYRNQLILHTGNALEIIPALNYKWDLVFIDADKTGYIDYYEMILPRLSERGIIIADNVLFHGQIFEEPIKNKNAKAIVAFNNHVKEDARTEQVLLTARDGLLLIKKKL
ncbi:MAG: O-methyltransferase [Bacteroidetes bacterium]|nr:O-methyltransferase [Bacteroidota bacterium]